MSSQPHFLGSMTLKALLEDPNLKNPPVIGLSGNQAKVKKEDGSDVPQYNYGSAFLGPALWDKSHGMDINLEYMDLDEFLLENDIPVNEDDALAGISRLDDPLQLQSGVNSPSHPVVTSPSQFLRTPPMSPSQFIKGSPISPIIAANTTKSPPYPSQPSPHCHDGSLSSCPPSPGTPGSPSFKVDFQVSEQDLALTTVPDYDDMRYNPHGWIESRDGHRPKMGLSFDPRKRNFSEEELKPQPIIKKSKKIFVPEDLKDDRYWARRVKNNTAAKRSRDARRVKENQIALRAAYLEKENTCLKEEMSKLRKENAQLKSVVDKYETTSMPAPVPSWPSMPQ